VSRYIECADCGAAVPVMCGKSARKRCKPCARTRAVLQQSASRRGSRGVLKFRDCTRCIVGMCSTGATDLCARCNDLLDRRIARWWVGTERATYAEAAPEFGLNLIALHGRVERLLASGVLHGRSEIVV
jgi:hypothetical protein